MDDGVIIFIPYGSRLGFHVGGPASTMANIDYKFPQCVCYEVPMDERLIVLNDQGGAVMDVSYEKTATLRANMGDNQPAVVYALEGNGARPSHRWGGTEKMEGALH